MFIKTFAWKITSYKFCELELFYETYHWLNLNIEWSRKVDHAGLRIEINFIGLGISCSVIDSRHWDRSANKWYEKSNTRMSADFT